MLYMFCSQKKIRNHLPIIIPLPQSFSFLLFEKTFILFFFLYIKIFCQCFFCLVNCNITIKKIKCVFCIISFVILIYIIKMYFALFKNKNKMSCIWIVYETISNIHRILIRRYIVSCNEIMFQNKQLKKCIPQ